MTAHLDQSRGQPGERGGAPSVEAALMAVLMGVLVVGFAVAAGRLVAAESATDHAARAATRAASLQRDPDQAQSRARAVAETTLAEQHLACADLTVAVDTSQFARPLGTPAAVRATVTCQVRWADLTLPGAPGARPVSGEFTSPIDQLRERVDGFTNSEGSVAANRSGGGR